MNNNASYTKSTSKVKELVQAGLIAAITFVAAYLIHIPYGNGGVVHFGDSIVFVAAILFGWRMAVLPGAIGMAFFDVASGYAAYAPYTFVIKALMALAVALIAYSGKSRGDNWIKNIIGMILGGAVMVGGYYTAEFIMTGNAITPIANMTGNVIQFAASAIIATMLTLALRKTKYFESR